MLLGGEGHTDQMGRGGPVTGEEAAEHGALSEHRCRTKLSFYCRTMGQTRALKGKLASLGLHFHTWGAERNGLDLHSSVVLPISEP